MKDMLEEPALRSWDGKFWEGSTQEKVTHQGREMKMEYGEMRTSRASKEVLSVSLKPSLITSSPKPAGRSMPFAVMPCGKASDEHKLLAQLSGSDTLTSSQCPDRVPLCLRHGLYMGHRCQLGRLPTDG